MSQKLESVVLPLNWLTINEVAKYVRFAPVTVRRWVKEGKLKTHQINRKHLVERQDVDDLVRSVGRAE